jgi:monomeric sarcosine oxidase
VGERRAFDVAIVGLGGIGSGAAYWAAKRAGAGVIGLERFTLGHDRGASQDHSRIIRLSYHTPGYVRFARDAYAAWAELEADSGERVVIRTGGIDLYPQGAHDLVDDYSGSLDALGIGYEWMDAGEAMRRWPQWRLGDDVRVMYQEASGIAAAARANAAHQRVARELGATLLEGAKVTAIRAADGGYAIGLEDGRTFDAERLIVAADAWTNELLAHFDVRINLTVTQEQVAYYAAEAPEAFAPERFPIWIWMGEPSYYGFPAFGEAGPKIGWDAGGPEVTGDTRTFEQPAWYTEGLDDFMREHLPTGFGPHLLLRSCLYTMPPDRDFILDRIPGQDRAVVGQGAAHAFKFASVFGRSLVELAFDGEAASDVSAWTIDRPVLTMDDPPTSWAM